jgi:hypothetical protein
MDWLRIGAFQLLILYHVGMAFVPWDYPVKLVTPGIPWATIPMFLLNPWRLSLLFVVSGYASAALYTKQGSVAGFIRSRLARLGIPLVLGMAVVVVPQPWVWLVTHFGYGHGFGYFVVHDYYRFQKIDGVAMPTWMHLWFVVYLLVYTVLLGSLLSLPARWCSACLHVAERVLAGPLLLPAGILWICAARSIGTGWEESHALVDDWTAHATYLPAFLFGAGLRWSDRLFPSIGRWWPTASVAAIGGWLVLASTELAWPGNTIAPHWAGRTFQIARAVESWCAIIALIGMADRFVNADHRWRATLAEAVFPFYLIHQTIIVVAGYALLSTATAPLARFAILLVITIIGCWTFYIVGRRVDWLKPAIGLSRRRSDNVNRKLESLLKRA